MGRKIIEELSKRDPITLGQYVALVDYIREKGTYFNFARGDKQIRDAELQTAMMRYNALTDEEKARAFDETVYLLLPLFGALISVSRSLDKAIGKDFERWGRRVLADYRREQVKLEVITPTQEETNGEIETDPDSGDA